MASVVRYNPANEFVTLRDAMDALFQDSFVRPWLTGGAAAQGNMAVDLYETQNEFVVKAVVPGIRPDDIDIQVVGDSVSIKAEAREDRPAEGTTVLYRERSFSGQVCRNFRLPTEVDANRADARFENGILTLTLPKAESARPKQIKIKTESK